MYRQIAHLLVLLDRGGVATLGKLATVRAQDHGKMGEHRNVVASSFVDEDLARGVREVVVATDNVRDVHECIVADHGEVIGGRAIERTRIMSSITSAGKLMWP